jgi:hypothetical protein
MAIDGVDSSSSAASAAREASTRAAQESQASQQVGSQQAQQAQQQAQQATRSGNPTTSQEVSANGQASRLERGAQSLGSGGDRSSGDAAQPARTSQRSAQANDGDVRRALERAEAQRPSRTQQPGDAHLRNGDHKPAPGSEEARQRAERASADARNPQSPQSARNFDRAAEEARARAGLDNGQAKPTRVDAKTGTETEHQGRGANGRPAQTSYDAAHRTPGQAHEKPHVGYANGRGAEVRAGNIPYDGPQQAARGAPSDPNTKVSEVERQHHARMQQMEQRVQEAQRTPYNQRTAEQKQLLGRAAQSTGFRAWQRFGSRGLE